jgi:pSer/pThr/pTyr-binding forkhead associated (FHA) protein
MAETILGELVPMGGGDSIPLTRDTITIGRRRSNDICLDFSNVSGQHCEFQFRGGAWSIRDLNSSNGIKVNGERVQQRRLKPGDVINISKHVFKIQYQMTKNIENLSDDLDDEDNVFNQSLLQKAGLAKNKDGNQ